jgi:hypothetical protein
MASEKISKPMAENEENNNRKPMKIISNNNESRHENGVMAKMAIMASMKMAMGNGGMKIMAIIISGIENIMK